MRKYLPFIFAFISLVVIYSNVFLKENILNQGTSIYVELEPVDPRSLIQGDYMRLGYQLNIQDSQNISKQKKFYKKTLKIVLDDKHVVKESFIGYSLPLQENERLLKTKSSQFGENLYPVSESFLFAEGLEYCYNQAKFAQLKVDKKGNAVLESLTDKNLNDLNCESQKRNLNL
ncbi:GDYXXLXY protein [Neisseriaceae bacterium PsAf]|nr:GDYXXLXY protein [Neisseriaceae bacterium PsAf]